MRSFFLAIGTCAALLNAVPAAGQGDQARRGGMPDEQQPGMLLRFQLIAATDSNRVDPAITAIDAVLKDLFRFPGYRLLSQAAVMMQRPAPARNNSGGPTMATQLLNGDGETYKLTVFIDSTTPQTVRMNVSLAAVPKPGFGAAGSPSNTLFSTSVEVSYGHTVVLGSTQPAGSSGLRQTLILAVRAESRWPAGADASRGERGGTTYIDGVPVGPVSGAWTDAQVDEAVLARSCSAPIYPSELRAARIGGSVSLRYIVGADGKAEPGSVKVVSSTNRAFEQPATNAILSCSFTAAKIKGAPVRQVVEQVVRFVPPKPE